MKMIPSQPYRASNKKKNNAEYRVFDKLKESFVGSNKYIAFHSLNLTRHQYKRFGEADFVIICEYGLFVFEVKGGSISCNEGVWHSTNDDGKHNISNPFTQAETAMHAIFKAIEETNISHLNIAIGYGGIFPSGSWTVKSSEWDREIICDANNFKNFEAFLSKFFNYWHSKKANQKRGYLSVENIKAIANFLRPNFEMIETLSNQLYNQEEITLKLTEDQYRYLDIVAANRRVMCSGGAGTGKTFLALELARRIAREDKRVVFVCKSEWLKQYLTSKISNEFVTISTIDSAQVDMRRLGVDKYEVLIVDEGQDLFNVSDIDKLDNLLAGELDKGEWYIFHDANHQALKVVDKDVLKFLNDIPHTEIPLITNCRNTNPILKYVENLLDVDMGKKDELNGPKVIQTFTSSETNTLENTINQLLTNGVPPSHITLLSKLEYAKSSATLLSDKLQSKIVQLDDYSIRNFPSNEMSFAEIENFKGLENEVIILIDLPKPDKNIKKDKALYYVAMSRAKGLLNIIYTN
ncbi:AAA family ATPase, partial [Candidatus Woesearchaeota archaeon]|jgi:hypothetical protein|nr:AAA family ATPase [Candidatus Woesearchaeota archaeon]